MNPNSSSMSSDLSEIRKHIMAVPPSDFDQLMQYSRNAAEKAQESYELLCKKEQAPRELIEALRLNITTFTLTMEKFNEASFKNGTDLKAICDANLNTLQILILESEKCLKSAKKVI